MGLFQNLVKVAAGAAIFGGIAEEAQGQQYTNSQVASAIIQAPKHGDALKWLETKRFNMVSFANSISPQQAGAVSHRLFQMHQNKINGIPSNAYAANYILNIRAKGAVVSLNEKDKQSLFFNELMSCEFGEITAKIYSLSPAEKKTAYAALVSHNPADGWTQGKKNHALAELNKIQAGPAYPQAAQPTFFQSVRDSFGPQQQGKPTTVIHAIRNAFKEQPQAQWQQPQPQQYASPQPASHNVPRAANVPQSVIVTQQRLDNYDASIAQASKVDPRTLQNDFINKAIDARKAGMHHPRLEGFIVDLAAIRAQKQQPQAVAYVSPPQPQPQPQPPAPRPVSVPSTSQSYEQAPAYLYAAPKAPPAPVAPAPAAVQAPSPISESAMQTGIIAAKLAEILSHTPDEAAKRVMELKPQEAKDIARELAISNPAGSEETKDAIRKAAAQNYNNSKQSASPAPAELKPAPRVSFSKPPGLDEPSNQANGAADGSAFPEVAKSNMR